MTTHVASQFGSVTTPESAPFDLDRIVDALAAHDVTYIVIGGTSGLLHGAVEHITRDVDMLIRSDRHNRRRLAEALTDLGAVSDHPIDAVTSLAIRNGKPTMPAIRSGTCTLAFLGGFDVDCS